MILVGPKGRAAGELGFRDMLASAVSMSVNDLMSSFLLLGQSLCRAISPPSLPHVTSGDREQMACFVNEIRISEHSWLSLSYAPFGNNLPAQSKHSVPPRAHSVHPHGKGHFSPMLP